MSSIQTITDAIQSEWKVDSVEPQFVSELAFDSQVTHDEILSMVWVQFGWPLKW